MILPGTTYKTIKDITVKGKIHFNKHYSNESEFSLPKETEFIISYWTEPSDAEIQVFPVDLKQFKGQILNKKINDFPFDKKYSFILKKLDVEENSILTYDFSKAIYFYSANEKFGGFSNFAAFGIDINGQYYSTIEHYFQSEKFINPQYSERIRNAKTPKEASDLGKSREFKIRDDWDDVKDGIMFKGLIKKFDTHQQLKDMLIFTGNSLLVENSPYDRYWGIGKNGDGYNKLGVFLMRIREMARKSIPIEKISSAD